MRVILILPYEVAIYHKAYSWAYWTLMLTCWTPWGTVKIRSRIGAN